MPPGTSSDALLPGYQAPRGPQGPPTIAGLRLVLKWPCLHPRSELAWQMLAPPPDMEWKKDQMDFRVAQCAEVQGVREAFIRQGKHVSMKTIERALSVPNERTFAECMAALCKSGQGLPSGRTPLSHVPGPLLGCGFLWVCHSCRPA